MAFARELPKSTLRATNCRGPSARFQALRFFTLAQDSQGLKFSFAEAKPQRRHKSMVKKLRYMSKFAAIFAVSDNT